MNTSSPDKSSHDKSSPSSIRPSLGLVLLLWVAGLGAAMQFAKIAVPFTQVQALYPSAGSELGLLVSIIGFLGIGLGLFAGLIVARHGFRRLLIFALTLGAAMSFYQSTLPPFELMLVSRLIEGASHLIIVVAAPTLLAQASSNHYRSLAMTLWSTFFGVAFALTAWFGLPLINNFGLAGLFLTHGIFMSCIAIMLAIWIPVQPLKKHDRLHMNFNTIFHEHIRAYSSPNVAAPALGWVFYTLTFVSMLTLLPGMVAEQDRIFVAGAMPLASIAVSLTCGAFILPRMSAVRAIILGFVLSLIVLIILWLSPDRTWPAIALLGTLGIVQAASFAAIPELNSDSEAQSRANGAMAQMGNLGNTLGTPMALIIFASFGFSGVMGGIALCFIAAIGVHVMLKRRRNHMRDKP